VVDRSTGNQSHVTANIIPFGTGAEFALSSDGHFLAFRNFSGKVIGEGTGEGIWDVFESNLQTATTTLVSVHGANPVNSTSETPTISSNGRLVAFASDAVDLVPNDENGQEDVFVRDVETGITTLASVNRFGTGSGHGRSHNPILSPDGRFLAFLSTADDLVSNVTNVGDSVFVRDLLTGTTTLASVDQSGVGETSREPALSADGRFVAFVSDVPLVANDTNGTSDVFVRDLQTGTTTLASVNRSGTNSGNNGAEFFDQFNQPGTSPLSADGRFVLFSSNSTDLTANSTNGLSNCFVRDFKMRTTTLLSVNRTGLNGGNEASACAVISANGRFAAFESGATDLLTNDTNGEQSVYVRPVVQE
jgi:Tol biopolymer transport system component